MMYRITFLFIVLINLNSITCELFAIKGDGNIGYFDNKNKWNLLYEKKKAIRFSSSSEGGLWIINKFNYVSKKDNKKNNAKWIKMRKAFTSLTLHYSDKILGVTDKGQIYHCVKSCNSPKQWNKFYSPLMTPIDKNDENIDSKIRAKLKMQPLLHGKLNQLTAFDNLLYGKDEIGNLWQFTVNNNEWIKIDTKFLLKWIYIYSNTLYVINEGDNKPYKIDLSTNKYELISDVNDFEQIIYDYNNNVIYGLNYYEQLFYLNKKQNDWIYVKDDIGHISFGQLSVINVDVNDKSGATKKIDL
eukprot:423462_1